MRLFSAKSKNKTGHSELPLLNENSLKTRYAESFRTLRTNIQFSLVENSFRSLLVTSAGASEGKTNTAANLAFTLAQAGKSVLIVDCDLRRPALSKTYDIKGSIGVTGLLTMIFSKSVNELDQLQHSFFDVLLLVKFQKRTGRLLIKDATDEVELFFANGQLVDLNWLTRPAEKKLSSILVENGHLTREQVEIALRRQQDTGNRLGFIIAKMGFMSESEINGLLTIHVMEVLHKAMDMRPASFQFTDLPSIEIDKTMTEILDLQEMLVQSTGGSQELPLIDGFIKEAIREIDENIHLLPAGIIPPNPSEMLGSARMEFLFSRLQEMYDVLVIDSPPLLPASDALVLAPRVDGVLVVVKTGFLNRNMVGSAIEQLRKAKANLLGVVLNQVDTKRQGDYKYYAKYYGEKG